MKNRFTILLAFCLFGHALTSQTSKSVTAGDDYTIVLKPDGSIYAFGYNNYGQLGNGTNTDKNCPFQIDTSTNWQSIVAGFAHVIAIKSDGSLWAWGNNSDGQLGNGTNLDKKKPVQVGIEKNWKVVAAGRAHTIGIKADGTLWAWGHNGLGQLGDGTTVSKNSAVQIGTSTNWRSAVAGNNFTIAIKTDGSLWAWGENNNGQLGDGTTVNKKSPVQIGSSTNWQSAAAGREHAVAVKTDGSLWAWGDNYYGQLGNGTTADKNSPVQIGTPTNWQSVAAGRAHTLSVKTDGSLWAWGYNSNGQLGDATNVAKSVPVQIGTDLDWQSVVAGFDHSIGSKMDGKLWSWGNGYYGQLGDGTNTHKNSPVKVLPAGDGCGCALDINALFGGANNVPVVSGIYDNAGYNNTGDPTTGHGCFFGNLPNLYHTIWFNFRGDGNVYYLRSIPCGASPYLNDTQLAIYSGECGNETPVACNDNEDYSNGILNFRAELETVDGEEYQILVNGSNGQEGKFCFEVTKIGPIAVTYINKTNIQVFPNPTSGEIQLKNVKADVLQVLDQMGRLVLSKANPGISIDISNMPTGVYFLKIQEGENLYAARVVKE